MKITSDLGEKLHEARKIKIWEKTQGKCYYCGKILMINLNDGKNHAAWTMDHVTPKTKGGTNTLDNLVPCCSECNQTKNDKDKEEYRFDIIMEMSRAMWGNECTEIIYGILTKEVANQLELVEPKFYFEKIKGDD
ncbi:MAG: HNH endonuclease [Promethearchaeota archaeon]|nr:MAG: HNH endonuclease [Candidatus Lokiarchaeota archaeon]